MTDRIWVKAAGKDRRVPVEGRRGVYFDPGKPHEVRLTPFIQRRLDEKDLVKTDAPPEPKTPAVEPAAEAMPSGDPAPVHDAHGEE